MNDLGKAESEFERRLRADLESIVEERATNHAAPREGELPAASTWQRRGVRFLAAGTAVAVVAAAALALSAGGRDTAAAFAVEAQPEGKVSVEVSSLEDAPGLEAALESVGINSSVTYLSKGMTCKEPRFRSAAPSGDEAGALISGPIDGDGPLRFTIGRGEVGLGQTLVVTAWPGPGVMLLGGAQVEVAEGAVAPCDPTSSGE